MYDGKTFRSKREQSMDSIYGAERARLQETLDRLLGEIDRIRADVCAATGMDPVEHTLGRIKSEESMREKCRRKGLPETQESALGAIRDAIGLRVVCAFLDDVYEMRDALAALPFLELVEEKDYIRRAKPNGYRSLHLIFRADGRYYAEVQLRTISMDTWAALEKDYNAVTEEIEGIYYKGFSPEEIDALESYLRRVLANVEEAL